jgi:hypothetical protein
MTTYDGFKNEFDVEDENSEFELDTSQHQFGQLIERPEPLNGIALPTVRNIEEAELICYDFDAVITDGPTAKSATSHPGLLSYFI